MKTKLVICTSLGLVAGIALGVFFGWGVLIAEMPAVRVGFNEPREWAWVPDSNKVPMTVAQRFIMNFTKQFPDGHIEIDTVLYIMEFDFEVATLNTDKYKDFISREIDYKVPVLHINPQALRMSRGKIINQNRYGAW